MRTSPLHSELLLLTTGIGQARPARSCRPTCQPLCRLAAPRSGVEFFPNLLAPAQPRLGVLQRSPKNSSDGSCARRGRTLLVGRSGRGPLGRPLSGSCGWLAVGVRQEREPSGGSGSFIQKSLLAVCLARRAKTGSLSYTAQARRLDSYQGVRPIMPEVGNCRLRRAGYLNYPFSDPARPHPPPPGAGAQQAQVEPCPRLSRLTNLVPPLRAIYTVHSKTANDQPLAGSTCVPKIGYQCLGHARPYAFIHRGPTRKASEGRHTVQFRRPSSPRPNCRSNAIMTGAGVLNPPISVCSR